MVFGNSGEWGGFRSGSLQPWAQPGAGLGLKQAPLSSWKRCDASCCGHPVVLYVKICELFRLLLPRTCIQMPSSRPSVCLCSLRLGRVWSLSSRERPVGLPVRSVCLNPMVLVACAQLSFLLERTKTSGAAYLSLCGTSSLCSLWISVGSLSADSCGVQFSDHRHTLCLFPFDHTPGVVIGTETGSWEREKQRGRAPVCTSLSEGRGSKLEAGWSGRYRIASKEMAGRSDA